MPKVLFLETRTVQREGGPTYEQGRVYELPHASAQHWLVRGVATTDPDAIAQALAAEKRAASAASEAAKAGGVANPEDLAAGLRGDIEIPGAWVDLPWRERLALAKHFDPEARSKDDAARAIAAEVARRAAGTSPSPTRSSGQAGG